MFPIILNPEKTDILVIGNGEATARRIELLEASGAEFEHLQDDDIAQDTFSRAGVVFIADFDDFTSGQLYEQAKLAGCLVNVEDKKHYCDFHVPAMVRRGELLLTVSTGGGSPRLARRLRMMLEQLFPTSWAENLKLISSKRDEWKAEGASFAELAENTDKLLDEQGWLKIDCACLRAANHSPLVGESNLPQEDLVGDKTPSTINYRPSTKHSPPTKSSIEDLTPPQGGSGGEA